MLDQLGVAASRRSWPQASLAPAMRLVVIPVSLLANAMGNRPNSESAIESCFFIFARLYIADGFQNTQVLIHVLYTI